MKPVKVTMLISRNVWNSQGDRVEVSEGETVEVSQENADILISAKHAEMAKSKKQTAKKADSNNKEAN